MKAENFDVQALIDYLQGTCHSLNEGVSELYPDMDENDLTEEDHADIDSQIFHCDCCSWWCEAHEQNDDGHCEDCCAVTDDDEENEDSEEDEE